MSKNQTTEPEKKITGECPTCRVTTQHEHVNIHCDLYVCAVCGQPHHKPEIKREDGLK
jgi:hypothetical protein